MFSDFDIDRFETYIQRGTEHWLWTGSVQNKGYGVIWMNKKKLYLAHRVMWMICYGPIPKNMTVDHVCNIKLCVYPDHLQLLTRSANKLRAIGDYCPKGHPYFGYNLYYLTNGNRACRTCHADWNRNWRRNTH